MEIRPYLQLTRAHTAPLETVPALVGAALAKGTLWDIEVALWGIFGVLYHLTGYGMNSYLDWKKGYDKEDSHKQHHPLNSGALSPSQGKIAVQILFLVTFVYAVVMTNPSILGYIILVSGVLAGVAYNIYGKTTIYKFLPISWAHTTVFIVPYVASGGSITSVPFLLGVLYVFLWVVFQISVSGEIKDIMEFQEANFLREILDVRVHTHANTEGGLVDFGTFSQTYTIGVKGLNLLAIAPVYLMLAGVPLFSWEGVGLMAIGAILLLMGLSMMVVGQVVFLIQSGDYIRGYRVRSMAVIELLTLAIFSVAYAPAMGLPAVVTLIGGSILWVIAGNKIEWGTILAPDV